MKKLIEMHKYVDCVLLLGGEKLSPLKSLFLLCKEHNKKTALYSGFEKDKFLNDWKELLPLLDYLKVGKYNRHLGGLNYPCTNQQLWVIKDGKLNEDITYKFWRGVNIR